jgi:hypothetical protein
MFVKKTLIEQFISSKKINTKYLPIDFELLKKEALESFNQKKVLNTNKFSPYKNYYQAKTNKHIVWIYDMIRDFYILDNIKTNMTPILGEFSYIVVNKDSDTFLHDHINEYDLNNSPDLTAFIPIVSDKDSFVEFFYEGGRKRHMRQRVALYEKEIILFNSELKHRLIINKHHKNFIFLSLKMQLVS